MKGVILLFISGYQKYISPLKSRTCRFYPTCSEYAYQSIQKFGIMKGSFYAFWRILRCNPFSHGGYDPIPKSKRT